MAAIVLLTGATAFAAETPSVRERALALLGQGEIKSAIQLVHSELGRNPKDVSMRQLLGRIVDFDGKPEAAIRIWKEGLTGAPSDYPLLLSIADRRRMQSEDGPNVTYKRGSVSYGPSKDETAERAFKKANAGRALSAYRTARELRPEEPSVIAHIGRLERATGDLDRALKTWTMGAREFPEETEFQLGWARVLRGLGRSDEAARHFESALKLDPRSAEAHAALAEIYADLSLPDKAGRARKRAAFYEWVPQHMGMTFSDERFEIALGLNPRLLGGKNGPELRSRRIDIINNLKTDKSEAATAFLAMLCFHHEDHGRVEDTIYAELQTRGEAGEARLLELLRHARSTCTARSASHALAAAGSDKAFPYLIDALPRDGQPYFFADVAGALRKLGDARAVPALIAVMNPAVEERKPAKGDDSANAFTGRLMNRKRCAASLSVFDTEKTRKALEEGVKNPQLSVVCGVSLYVLTKDKSHLTSLEDALKEKKRTYGLGLAVEILGGVDLPEAESIVSRINALSAKR